MTRDDRSNGSVDNTGHVKQRGEAIVPVDPEVGGLYVPPTAWMLEFCTKADIWLRKRGLVGPHHPWGARMRDYE